MIDFSSSFSRYAQNTVIERVRRVLSVRGEGEREERGGVTETEAFIPISKITN